MLASRRFLGHREFLDLLDFRIVRGKVFLAILLIWWAIPRSTWMPLQASIAEMSMRAPVVLLGAYSLLAHGPLLWPVPLEIRSVSRRSRPVSDAASARAV